MKYLRVDEQATYIDVHCDGFVVRVSKDSALSLVRIYDSVLSDYYGSFWASFYTPSYTYALYTDSTRTTEIIENTPTRVKIRIFGNWHNSTDGYLTNSTSIMMTYTIYADRIVSEHEWVVSGTISLTGSLYRVQGLNNNSSFITNENNIYENSGAESDASDYTHYDSAKYIGMTSDEVNIIQTILDDNLGLHQRSDTDTYGFMLALTATDVEVTAGTYNTTTIHIIDSAQREKTEQHTDLLFHAPLSDVDNLTTGLTKVGSPTNAEGGIQFDASGESITMPTAGRLDISKGTIEFEFRSLSAFSDSAAHVLFGTRGSANAAGDFWIGKWSDNIFYWIIVDSGGTPRNLAFSSDPTGGNWTSNNHYRFVWDSSTAVDGSNTMAVYVNGVLITQDTQTNTWTDATLDANIGIGNDYEDTTRFANGIIKNLWISDQPNDKKFSSVERLEIGNQYKDNLLDTLDSSVLFEWHNIDVDNLPSGLTKDGSPTNSEGGVLCDASGEIISLTSAGNFDILQGAVEFDFKSNSVFADSRTSILFGTIGGGMNAGDFFVTKWNDNVLFFTIVDNNNALHYIEFNAATGIGDNWTEWNRLRFVWDSSGYVEGTNRMAVYKNGVLLTPSQTPTNQSFGWPNMVVRATLGIGNDPYYTGYYSNGIIKNFIISDDPSVEVLRKPTTGSFVQDSRIPANIPTYQSTGFATDGAFHIEPANDIAKITWDRTRISPSVVVEDFGFKTGTVGSETDHLVGHWKMDDNAASTTITDETGNYDGVLSGGDNTSTISQTDAVRGRSLLTDGSADYIDLSSALAGLTTQNKFAILIKAKPNFSYNVGSTQGLFGAYDGTDYIVVQYNYTSDYFRLTNTLGALNDAINTRVFTSDNDLKQWHIFGIHVDVLKGVVFLSLNGEIIGSSIGTMSWSTTISTFRVGSDVFSNYGAYYIDEVKLFDGCLLPFGGGPFVGNGSVDVNLAHSDVLFHWDCESTSVNIPSTKTVTLGNNAVIASGGLVGLYEFDSVDTSNSYGSVPVVSGDIINPKKGSIRFWAKLNSSSAAYDDFFGFGPDADNTITIGITNTDVLRCIYRTNAVNTAIANTVAMTIGRWYYIEMTWDDVGYLHFYINKIEIGTPQVIANQWNGSYSATLYFAGNYVGSAGADVSLDQVFITNNPNTPDLWSVMGLPLHYPIRSAA